MNVTIVMANVLVADADQAVRFYTRLFGRGPDSNPMDKLHEWHFDAGAVQVYEEPARAGRSGVTLNVSDLDAAAASLDAAAIEHGPATEATYVRIVQLADPDGNRIVLTVREVARRSGSVGGHVSSPPLEAPTSWWLHRV